MSVGNTGENAIYDYFMQRGFDVEIVNDMETQRRGIDAYVRIGAGEPLEFSLEIKTDTQTNKTGNTFIEFVSNTSSGKIGWIFYSEADYLAYYVLGDGVYFFRLEKLRGWFVDNIQTFKIRKSRNPSYFGLGCLVPLKKIQHISCRYISENSLISVGEKVGEKQENVIPHTEKPL